jgi:glycosyltransferase involved in cell wall biosynthesis
LAVSIILCTYNGVSRLTQTLEYLCKLELLVGMELELIVVDNASIDETNIFCNNYLKQNATYPWKVVYEAEPGLIHARQKGISESQFDILLFCDDDNYLVPSYVRIGADIMSKHIKIGALGGYGEPLFEGKKPDWFDNYHFSFAVGKQAEISGKINSKTAEIYGAASFWRKSALHYIKQNGIKTVLTGRRGNQLVSGDDVEWCYLVQLAGYEIWYEEKLKFKHLMTDARLTWNYYLKLKKGISAGSALLFPYGYLLHQKGQNNFLFSLSYWLKAGEIFIRYIFFIIKNGLFSSHSATQKELSAIILKSRMMSYFNNYKTSLKQFKKLQSII